MSRCCSLVLIAALATGATARGQGAAPATPATALPTARTVLGPGPAATQPAPAAADLPPGSVVGSVRFKGPRHEGERLDLPPALRPVCGAFKRTYPYQVTEASKLAGVVLWLDGVGTARPAPDAPLTLTVRRCEWQPELATATRGQVLVLANQDAEAQQPHLRWPEAGESRDLARRPLHMWIPARGQQLAVRLEASGVAELTSSVGRPWQRARVRVFEHDQHTTSGERGDFELPAVPPGSYTLHAWHPALGETTQPVTVLSGRASNVQFTFTPEGPEGSAPAPARAAPASRPGAAEASHAP